MNGLRIATRGSRLALWQAEHVAGRLAEHHPTLEVELLPMTTRGDRQLDRSLLEIGGKGVFLKELERALLDGLADIAVHSLKDVPANSTDGLRLAAFLPRELADDAWIAKYDATPAGIARGARVGTSSLRRQVQLLALRPDLNVLPLRGNVDTRLARFDQGDYDAIILARAGLRRLGLESWMTSALAAPAWLPAPGQGVICIQCRADDARTLALVEGLNCSRTVCAAEAERALVEGLGGDCRMPLAAMARVDGDQLTLIARLFDPATGQYIESVQSSHCPDARNAGARAASVIVESGGAAIIENLD